MEVFDVDIGAGASGLATAWSLTELKVCIFEQGKSLSSKDFVPIFMVGIKDTENSVWSKHKGEMWLHINADNSPISINYNELEVLLYSLTISKISCFWF